ncbi:MAG: SDR family oxidoreductase [Patescibacteria group bacterium]|jgi:short-subunit dehydrogenase
MNLKNKTILVTGAGSGIGRELTLALLKKGAEVAAIDIREETLHETKKLAGNAEDRISVHVLNIADKSAVKALPKEIIDEHGNIDGIINNAGIIQPFVKIVDLDYEAIDKVMGVNFYGTLYITKAFLPLLLKRPEGYIVNVSSMGGFLPVPGQSVYGASKAAVKLLTEGLYAELKDTNVHVTVVFPGATKTNIATNSDIGTPKESQNDSSKSFPMLPAEKAAEIIISAIEKNKSMVFTGKDSKFMDILYRLNPIFATNFIEKQMRSLLK